MDSGFGGTNRSSETRLSFSYWIIILNCFGNKEDNIWWSGDFAAFYTIDVWENLIEVRLSAIFTAPFVGEDKLIYERGRNGVDYDPNDMYGYGVDEFDAC